MGGFQPNTGGGLALAAISTTISVLISASCIYMHATNYSMPRVQRLIMRILFVCPVYSLGAVLSLHFPRASMALDTLRDIMEAFVIYSFLCLVLEYAGGDATCVNRIKNEPPLRHPFPLCFLRPVHRDGRFLRICKQGTLQFVIMKPVMAMVTLIMISKHQYDSPAYQGFQMVIYNLSYSMALYCLLLFYLGTRGILAQFSPVRKFLAVKSIIFATYWQSLVVRLWVGPAEANAWNNFIICIEMVPFSIFLGIAFSHREYIRGIPDSSVLRSIKEVFSVRDVVQDAVHNFLPTYQDYVLQRPSSPSSSGSAATAPRKYRARTFLAGNIDRWQLMDHDQLEHEDGMMLEDDVSVDGLGTDHMELGEANSPQRPSSSMSTSSSSAAAARQQQPTTSLGSRATGSHKMPAGGGGQSRLGSSSSRPPPPSPQDERGASFVFSGRGGGDLISLQSPPRGTELGTATSSPLGTGSSRGGGGTTNVSPSKVFTNINLETP